MPQKNMMEQAWTGGGNMGTARRSLAGAGFKLQV
jgi:hypothetical protein